MSLGIRDFAFPPSRRTMPLACVMGDMDLLRPLGRAGIPCAVAGPPGSKVSYSRFTRATIAWADFWEDEEGLLDLLMRFGAAQAERPILFYEEDSQLLLVSRRRDRLAQAFRFVIPDPELVEDLVDKARFQNLAERLNLNVPPTRCLRQPFPLRPPDLGLRYPIIVKPVTRNASWQAIGGDQKALPLETAADLARLWPRLSASRTAFIAQELISGPETSIHSYHVYVDASGGIAGEFTGKKIRTLPPAYGHSTALTIVDAPDLRAEGRALVTRLGFRGVAKFDFKRAADGRLFLLEVNPRFNLWHNLGAVGGVNLPALVYADMTGLPRPPSASARAGVRWCRLMEDRRAARASGLPMSRWLSFALRCEAKSALAWDDPMPLLRTAFRRLFAPRRESRP